jgi:hypothetical protein
MADYDSRPETQRHIEMVKKLILQVISELAVRAREHDASKLEDPELTAFNEYTPKLAAMTYGSSEYKTALQGLGPALVHHYTHNRHHPEHHPRGVNDMTLIDLVEMLCDWIAATKRHADGDIQRSFLVNRDRFGISDQLMEILKNTVTALEASR